MRRKIIKAITKPLRKRKASQLKEARKSYEKVIPKKYKSAKTKKEYTKTYVRGERAIQVTKRGAQAGLFAGGVYALEKSGSLDNKKKTKKKNRKSKKRM